MNVAQLKGKPGHAVALSQRTAISYDVFFQVKPDDVCIHTADHGQIVVEDKRQIAFSAAEIDDVPLFARVGADDIVDKFDIAVDLAELVVAGPHDFAFFCHNTEIL